MEVDLFLGGWIAAKSIGVRKPVNYFANVVIMFLVINYIWLIVSLFRTHYKYILPTKNKKLNQFTKDLYEKYNKGFLGMFSGFRPEFKYAAFLNAFYILKDMLVPAVLIFGVSSPYIQLLPMVILQIVLIVVLIYYRPYEKGAENVLAIYNAVLYFFGILFFFLMASLGKFLTEQQRYMYLGFPLIGILVLIIIANIGYGVFDSVVNVVWMVKNLFKGKKKINKVDNKDKKKKKKTDGVRKKKKPKKKQKKRKNEKDLSDLDNSTTGILNGQNDADCDEDSIT